MPTDVDPFVLFRWLLALVGTVYTVVCAGESLYRWLGFFGSSREKALLGRYTLVLLLRTRFRRFAGELSQIGLLLIVLAALVWGHWY